MRRVRRMGIVTRNHLEAFILLLQDEFRSQRSEGSQRLAKDGVRLGAGTTAVKGKAFTPVAATAPPMRMANLPAMPLKKLLLIVLHTHSLNPQNPDCTDFIPRIQPQKRYYFRPICRSETHWSLDARHIHHPRLIVITI